MKKIVLVFGAISGLISGGMFFIKPVTDDSGAINFDDGMLLGYITMTIALSTIFFAVKQYRDKHLDGDIKFGKAFLIGLLITLVAGVIYVAAWELFLKTSNLDFAGQYMTYLETQLEEKGIAAEEIKTELASTKEMMDNYNSNTPFRWAITFAEIFPVGLLISLISALIFGVFLKRKKE